MATFIHHLTSSTPSIPSALKAFTQNIHFNTPQNLEQSLTTSYNSLLKLGASTSHTNGGHSHLVEFLLELRKTPNPTPDAEIWGEKFKWENLPLWGPAAREIWDITEPDPTSPTVKEEDKQKWINQNAFLALLTSKSASKDDALDFAIYGIWALKAAFEEAEPKDVEAWVVDAAGVWIIYAGENLKRRSGKGENWEGRIARGGAKVGGEDWKGLSSERWGVWVAGLEKATKESKSGVLSDAKKVVESL